MADKKMSVSRREFCKRVTQFGLAGSLLLNKGCKTAFNLNDDVSRPNVILVIIDDQGYGDMACHGNPWIKTPNIDKLHEQSVRLTNYHVGPTCAPTRAALMTGRYCDRTGVWHTVMGRSLLRKDEMTLGDVFSANGYATGFFGKWHLGDNTPYRPEERGFDEVVRHGGGGVTQAPDYWGNDYFSDTYWHNGKPQKYEGYCTDVWFDNAIRFIKDNRSKPFFCYLATNAPHRPFNVEDKYSSLYKDNPNIPNPYFYGMITNMDENLGRLEAQLERLGLRENTLLIFTTDNGTVAGYRKGKGFNAGMRGIKGSEYDGGHRVPCFLCWPKGGLVHGQDVSRLTAHIDLMPTLIDLCGLKKPAGMLQLDGKSLRPLITESSAGRSAWPDRVLVTDSQRIENPEKWRKSAVMTDRWRLINGRELYDMDADPGQQHDVAGQHKDVVKRLRGEYEKWWASVSRRFDEYCPIILGSDRENPVRLVCHDWHGGNFKVPWNQQKVREGIDSTGFWAVDVCRAGDYEVELRRWPKEADAGITDPVAAGEMVPGGFQYIEGKALPIVKARLAVADVDVSAPVKPGQKGVTFRVRLPKGETTLESWFYDADGTSRGAFYVYVKRI